MKISFYGGVKSVTGANYVLSVGPSSGGKKIMVDCGLFQGSKYAEDLNYNKFPYNPSGIDCVFITHSHADHIGRLPKLVKEGFGGKIYCTKPTLGLMKRAFPDNWKLIVQEAKDDLHPPLFNEEDIEKTLSLVEAKSYYEAIDLGGGIYGKFHNAGHIIGSAIVEIGFGGQKIFFTGDLGNSPAPLLSNPDFASDADYVVIESAYGSRIHEDRQRRKDILEDMVEETVARGGTLMIPSFAIERTQELLFELNDLMMNKRIPSLPVFIDSPLAQKMTEVYKEFPSYLKEEALKTFESGEGLFEFQGLKFSETVEESKAINDMPPPRVIIAGSGMSNGGRILHHERRYLSDPKSAILFIGYQVKGSLGRRILDGEPEVKIFSEKIPIKCHIKAIGGYSAHADQNQLVNWVEHAKEGGKLKRVFIVQGEEESATSLALKLRDNLLIDSTVPNEGDEFEIG